MTLDSLSSDPIFSLFTISIIPSISPLTCTRPLTLCSWIRLFYLTIAGQKPLRRSNGWLNHMLKYSVAREPPWPSNSNTICNVTKQTLILNMQAVWQTSSDPTSTTNLVNSRFVKVLYSNPTIESFSQTISPWRALPFS